MDEIKKLTDKRVRVWESAKAILDRAETEDRAMSADEEQQWNRYNEEIDALGKRIEDVKKRQERDLEFNRVDKPEFRTDPEDTPERRNESREPRDTDEYRGAFESYLRHGIGEMDIDQRRILRDVQSRGLQADSGPAGGSTVAPTMFVRELIKAVDNEVFIRQFATKHQLTSAASMGAPELASDPDDAEWQTELKTGTEDSAMKFGGRELHPHLLVKLLKVSQKLLRQSSLNIDQIVRDRLSYKTGVTQENAFLNGNGNQRPLGVFTASAQGVNTDRDVSTGNEQTNIGADGLIEAKYTLKAQYHKNAIWTFHRDGIKRIRKLKDGSGDYLWRAGIATDKPDTILDLPYYMSEYVPNTWTSGLYVGILGDFRHYWIADSLYVEIQRLDELYSATNQVGFIVRSETDGMPVLSEAFVRVKLA